MYTKFKMYTQIISAQCILNQTIPLRALAEASFHVASGADAGIACVLLGTHGCGAPCTEVGDGVVILQKQQVCFFIA